MIMAAKGEGCSPAPFTIIWTIELFNPKQPHCCYVRSPEFVVDSMEKTKWNLYFKVDPYFVCVLYRENDNGPQSITIEFEMAILAADGSPLIKVRHSHSFRTESFSNDCELIKRYGLLKRRGEFLPKETLTLRCRMWRTGSDISTADLCFARTVMRVERRCFIWAVREFSTLAPGQSRDILLHPTKKGGPVLSLLLYEDEDGNDIHIDIAKDDSLEYNINCVVSIINVEGIVGPSKFARLFWRGKRRILAFPSITEKRELLKDNGVYLLNDVLTLRCEFDVCLGMASNRLEDYRQCATTDVEAIVPADDDDNSDEEEIFSTCRCPLKQAIKCLYEQGTLSDVNLRAGRELFPAHTAILSARSPVFKAMFTNDMREKTSRVADLQDLDTMTLKRLLLFMYTDSLEDLRWASALSLFEAADKYEVVELREKCSAFLRKNLCKSSVCDLLHLSDTHNDEELKRAAQDFVFGIGAEFMRSEEWKRFRKDNIQLALETVEYVYSKKEQI